MKLLQSRIKALEAQCASHREERKKLLHGLHSLLNLGRHIYLHQMACMIVHAQISCLVRVSGYSVMSWFRPYMRNCRAIRFRCESFPGCGNTAFMKVQPTREPRWIEVEGVYLGSFIAQRIQRAWRRYMVRRRRMALCMASNPRLGAGASPMLGVVIRVLCVEDLVRIV